MLPTLAEMNAASKLVGAHVPPTPQYRWPLLCKRVGTEVWVKHENHTPVGASRSWTYEPALKDGVPVKVWKFEKLRFEP